MVKLNFILDIVDSWHVVIAIEATLKDDRLNPEAVGKSLGKDTVMYPPKGRAFLTWNVIVYVEVALTTIEEEARDPENKVTAWAVKVRPEFSISTGVDVLV